MANIGSHVKKVVRTVYGNIEYFAICDCHGSFIYRIQSYVTRTMVVVC